MCHLADEGEGHDSTLSGEVGADQRNHGDNWAESR